ncbi:MAG TPA: O-antigen ligase family protein [Candidatus Saccharimonadales bacterium]|nr:O-antigen ligase family protein [Candidatus Saccharimonadales bacterium]
MNLIKLLLVFCLLSIIPGQLVRIPTIGSAILTVGDIATAITFATSFIYLFAIKKSIKLDKPIVIPTLIFTLSASASTILALNNFTTAEVVSASLFLLRFMLYFSLAIIVPNIIKKGEVENWLKAILAIGVIYTVIGFFQILIFPDLTFLSAYGWDPHQSRIVSTFLDPNFSGGFLTIPLALSLSLFLKTTKKIYLLVSLILFTGIVLTFSRSSYLAALAALSAIGLLKSPKLLIVFLMISFMSYLVIPQVRVRIMGAFAVDETSQARIESWQKALVIFQKYPVFGVGFNTYRYAQEREGFFTFEDPLGGHSGGGVDSSILLVAATTGIIGLISYLLLLFSMVKKFANGAGKSALHLGALASVLALIIHSQFVNSLFFPQIMIFLWFMLGLSIAYDS